jgi:hypothetical protein
VAEAEELSPLTVRRAVRAAVGGGALHGLVRGLLVGLAVGAASALVTGWAYRRILEQRLEDLEPVVRRRLADALPAGIEMALRHPAETVYACVVTRIGHPSSISLDLRGRGGGPPTAHPEHVRVFFDREPCDGELGHGVSGDLITFESWTEYGHSTTLDELMEKGFPTLHERFVRSRRRALAAYYHEHPDARPLSAVSSTPHEDPGMRAASHRPEK